MTSYGNLKRVSLVSQATDLLESGIRRGRWVGELPGQHALCDELVISRKTLRLALQSLAARGLVKLHQGRSTAILAAVQRHESSRIRQVVLMLPQPLWRLRPSAGQWVSELRSLLQPSGLDLVLCESSRYFQPHAGALCARLVAAHPNAAWVLFSSTRAMQQWFAERRLRTIVVGSVFAKPDLPSIAYDHAAIAQHAAARLAAAGHRYTAILLQHTGSAADAATVQSFGAWRRPGAPPPLVLTHDGSPQQIAARLRRLAALRERPTGLFVTKSLAIPVTLSLLPRLGLEIPRDLSVMCREDDMFLEYCVPTVARYRSNPSAISRRLAVALTRLAAGEPLLTTHERIKARYLPGDSIAPPRAPGGTERPPRGS